MTPFHYVVVGAGSAGCVVASRLSADPSRRVVLLEAGGADTALAVRMPAAFGKLFGTAADWNYRTVAQAALDARTLYWPRGKMLGGSSSMNAQMWVRGHPLDYDGWAAAGNTGWGSADVLKCFLRMEDFARAALPQRGRGGPQRIEDLRDPNETTRAFVRAAVAAGIPENTDINGERNDGVGLTQVSQKRGRRWSAADAYLRPARRRPNLTVMTGAHVTRVVFEGGRATGVEFVQAGQPQTVRAEREVILAAGAVNTPQLLLLSGVGPAEALRGHGIPVIADAPGVGQNLQDHLSVAVVVACRRPVTLAAAETPWQLARWLLFRRGMLTSNIGEACALIRCAQEARAPDIELIFAPVAYINHGLVKHPGHAITIGVILLQPESVGSITLRSSDPFAAPLIEPRYLSDPAGADLRLMVDGVKLARRVMATPPLADYVGDPIAPAAGSETDAELAAFVRAQAETLYHPIGTCRMGTDAAAVVTPDLCVRGVERLRVADASIMPRIVRGHTNAPAIMIGEKASDLILSVRHARPDAVPSA